MMVRPWFYDKFVCTADKCTDNCCIGWEIDIDPPAMERFRKVPGEFGEQLRGAIHDGGQPTFAQKAGERCALLRDDGLCELILNCGEDSLCDICALHPRFFNDFGNVREGGLGLCCEEVCRLMFSSGEPLRFVCDPEDTAAESSDDEVTKLLRAARERLYSILQDREKSLFDRLSQCAEYGWKLQEMFDGGELWLPDVPQEWESIFYPDDISRLLDALGGMESINGEWTELLERLTARQEELLDALPEFLAAAQPWRYEHIAVYTLFRQLTDSICDGAVYARVMLACCSAIAVMMMDCMKWLDRGNLTEWDCILDLKLYSKQVEYSQENIDAFVEEYF